MNNKENNQLDDIDYKILNILTKNAMLPYTDVAKEVFVSPGTVHVRMKKMEQMGIILGSHLVIDYTKIGYSLSAFIGIFLKESSLYNDTIKKLLQVPEILTMNYTTGNYSIFIKITCRDTNHLMELLTNKIQKIESIERTETFISLQESANRPLEL